MQLFEYCVFFVPNEEQSKAGQTAVILVQPQLELAETKSAVEMKAIRAIPKEFEDRLAQITIAVRPF